MELEKDDDSSTLETPKPLKCILYMMNMVHELYLNFEKKYVIDQRLINIFYEQTQSKYSRLLGPVVSVTFLVFSSKPPKI